MQKGQNRTICFDLPHTARTRRKVLTVAARPDLHELHRVAVAAPIARNGSGPLVVYPYRLDRFRRFRPRVWRVMV